MARAAWFLTAYLIVSCMHVQSCSAAVLQCMTRTWDTGLVTGHVISVVGQWWPVTLAHTPGSYAVTRYLHCGLWVDINIYRSHYLSEQPECDSFKSPVPTLTVCKSVLEANITNQRGETTFWSYFWTLLHNNSNSKALFFVSQNPFWPVNISKSLSNPH